MLKFTGNYCRANENFVIQNINTEKRCESSIYFKSICVLKNILQRGVPTKASQYLQESVGKIDASNKEQLSFISKSIIKWYYTIKGDYKKRNFPARDFFYKTLPNYIAEYSFIIGLIVPEVKINEITGIYSEGFINEQVDFYLPQAKLVIEIDGFHHVTKDFVIVNDDDRIKYLQEYGIKTIRITTYDLKNKNIMKKKIQLIINRCKEFENALIGYREFYSKYSFNDKEQLMLKYSAIFRLQILILTLLEYGVLKLEEIEWNINIINNENLDMIFLTSLAIEDIFLWLKHLTILQGIKFAEPRFKINIIKEINSITVQDGINIDFSLLDRWSDESEIYKHVIFVRNDYFDEKDYFKVSTADPIKYNIIPEGEPSRNSSIDFIINNIFGYPGTVTGQLPIIINALNGNDTIGLLPTGGGKSLCYQLCVLLQPCVSFCVVPIKSLMYDQYENLKKKNITRINYINGDQDAEVKDKICREFSEGRYMVIWISPERFQTKSFRDYLTELNKNQTIAFAVIDEVHCLSEWGHDFRTSYLHLCNTIRKYCPSTRFLGLTATASINVLNNILIEFETGKENAKTILEYTRPELSFIVYKDESENLNDKYKNLEKLLESMDKNRSVFEINGNETKSGIIFTTIKNGTMGCYKLANKLCEKYKDKVKWYSGELPNQDKNITMSNKNFDEYKKKTQEEFMENKFPLLVATKAFGMGIDKGNVRYTIHYGLPGSLESLYQEAGRAGRDKKSAACYVLYSREKISEDEFKTLFALNTPVEQLNLILNKYNVYEQRDVLRNFYLWVNNNLGVEQESFVTNTIFKLFAKPNGTKLISCKNILRYIASEKINIKNAFGIVQKAIYRLSLLGIVEDWTIEGWRRNGAFEVVFRDYNNATIFKSLNNYIRKYDTEFDIAGSKDYEKYYKYRDILQENIDDYEKAIRVLIQWSYDNIFYGRRQSLNTLVELCEEFSKGQEQVFKNKLESYFKLNESTYVLEHISENSLDIERWFQVFYVEEKGKRRFRNKSELDEIKMILARFLESYRYNTGLNFISGIIRLLTGGYQDPDGKERFIGAFKDISKMGNKEKDEILLNSLDLGTYLDDDNKENLSEVLCEFFQERKVEIYKELNDSTSLNLILSENIIKLSNIGGKFL